VRYRIVQSLAERGECIVGDLVLELPVAQPTVSEHLKVLRDAGIVKGTVDGPNRCYCLDPDALRTMRSVIETLEARACC
jgi:ArsR family transcriptional regulator, arsenate/arsenite/antimonite-responsive transcriptional repressor